MCGIVGIVSANPVNQQVYDALGLLQHRGQDSTGIATADGSTIHLQRARGQVREAYRTRDMRSLLGTMGLGHVRYTTRGDANKEQESQPFYVNAPYGIVLVHNGNLTNTRELKEELFSVDRRHLNTDSDTELLVNVLAHELQQQVRGTTLDPDQVFDAIDRRPRAARLPRSLRHPPAGSRPQTRGSGRLRVDRGERVARARIRRVRAGARRRTGRGDLHHP
jgi:amidophosphoribosyltransferase